MQRNRQRITEPQRTSNEKSDVEGQEGQRHISSRRTRDDERAKAGDQKSEPRDLSPLARQNPTEASSEHHDECEIGWVKDVFILPSNDELASDCNDGGECRNSKIVGAKEETQ